MKFKVYQLQHTEDESEETAELIHKHIFSDNITSEILPLYQFVAVAHGQNRDEVFRLMNLWEDPGAIISYLPCRSLSVGDILVDEYGKAYLCASVGWETLPDEMGKLLPHRAVVKFLDYEIVNSANGDGWVITKPSGQLWECHLGNYTYLDDAKKDCVKHFMIARPQHFAVHVRRHWDNSGTYMEYYKLVDVAEREGIRIPDEVRMSDDGNSGILFVSGGCESKV